MTVYLIKFLICSALLYAFYHLLLKNEVTLRFNRFYLLSMLVISALVPFTVTSTRIIPVLTQAIPQTTDMNREVITLESTAPGALPFDLVLWQLMLMIYVPVSLALIFRYFRNLYRIGRLKRGATVKISEGLRFILRSDITETFSFLNTIYANKEQFERGQLPNAIVAHESAHIGQRHSYDLIFFELLACVLWFNPVVYLCRRAIKLNHEFLADRHVVQQTGAVEQYQHLLIRFASRQHLLKLPLVSQLTYGETKQRIIIMAKQSSKGLRAFKKSVAFLLVAALFFWLGKEKTIAQQAAQEQTKNENEQVQKDRPPPPPPVMVRLHSSSRVRFTNASGKRITSLYGELSADEKAYFLSLGDKGQIQIPPPPRAFISDEMLQEFTDEKKYRVWIDDEPTDNASLNEFKKEDFHHFFKTAVTRSSKDYGKYEYKLQFITMKAMETFMKGHWLFMNEAYIPKPDSDQTEEEKKN